MKLQDFKYLITQSFQEWSEDKASRLAAALAYYTVFSIPPLLIIVLAITGQVFDDAQARITAEITSFIGETGSEAIIAILENASKPGDTLIATISFCCGFTIPPKSSFSAQNLRRFMPIDMAHVWYLNAGYPANGNSPAAARHHTQV